MILAFYGCILAIHTSIAVLTSHQVELLSNVTDRLSMLVNHYTHRESGINVDGLFGLRIAQGNFLYQCVVKRYQL